MFRFKQFTIRQDRCAMKVCTDSCILGASTGVSAGEKILDIGTGTGLLSLMLAQKAAVEIDAIEINPDAAAQAAENVSASPFSSQIKVYHTDIRQFSKFNYDLIIANPPFFNGQLLAEGKEKNDAKHDTALSLEELIKQITTRLSPVGRASIMLPPTEMKQCIELMQEKHYSVCKLLKIRHNKEKDVFREIALFMSQHPFSFETELYIYDIEHGRYSDAFKLLLRPYYLIF